jgi:hypothetical protein
MQEAVGLRMQRRDHARLAMAGIQAADAAREIEIAVAIHIFDDGAFSTVDENGRHLRYAARHGCGSAVEQRARAWAGNWSLQRDGGHGVVRVI